MNSFTIEQVWNFKVLGNGCHGKAYGCCIVNEVNLRCLQELAKTATIYLITHMLKRSCHLHCNLFSDTTSPAGKKNTSDVTTARPLHFSFLMQKPLPISKMRHRQRCVKLACLHNLPRHLFLTIWKQSQSAFLPTALWRSARVVLQPYHSCRRAPGFKTQQSDGLSLTPSRLSVSHSASLPILLLLQICSLHIYPFLLSISFLSFFFLALLLSSPLFSFALAPLSLGSLSPLTFTTLFITSLSPRLNFIPSSSSSFFFCPGCHHPSLLLPPLPPLTQPICLFTFWQTLVSLY